MLSTSGLLSFIVEKILSNAAIQINLDYDLYLRNWAFVKRCHAQLLFHYMSLEKSGADALLLPDLSLEKTLFGSSGAVNPKAVALEPSIIPLERSSTTLSLPPFSLL